MEDTLRFPTGTVPQLPPKDLPPDIIEAWRAEWRLELQRQSFLTKILDDPNRVPREPRFRLLD
jgi:hypothetical protein